ncbi:synaptotagmin-like protein 2 isoform X6 [Triplophysa dalaica]|uniref:synaptotagmin-like protein 2 isoform X6 n=1 Tax=Triplophysa dalaica TaxID=1582913 RepID=UPI0024DF7A4C|nr:synaptotagmin-like protein 2 isoform X6 [Triplophysa dalaica]
MIDLSYLTDEEQGKILAVLKRDTKLKNSEEQRIKKLHKTEKDKSRLKYLTGEWFYESKYHRHRDKIYGSDIIRASMGLRKPVTILELSQRWDEKDGFANREKRDVFIPPELVGLIEEPSTQSQSDRVDDLHSPDPQEQQRPQIKTRQNPFNSVNLQRVADGRINGVKEADQTPTEDHHELCAEPQSTQVSNFTSTADLTGKAFQLSNECQTHKVTEEEGRSIPKVLEWLWRDSQDGKLTKSVQREKNQMDPKDCGTSRAESPVVQQKTMPSPKPHRGLFALFSRAENKNRSLEVLVTNEEVTSQDNSTSEFKPDADDNIGLQDQNTKSKILQLENGNKAGGPVCEDSFQREIFLQTEVSPGRLANLKSFWERGMRRPKIPSMKNDEDEKQESEPSPQNVCNALDLSIGLLKSNEVILSNQNEKPSDLDSSEVNEDPVTKQQTDLIKTDVESLLSSSLLNDTDNTPDDKLKGDALTESLSTDTSDQRKEISTFKMSLSQQENKLPIDDLKSFWEKERSVLVDDGLIVKEEEMEMNKKKQSLSTLPEQKQQDVRGDSEEDCPVKAALECAKPRPISISKSLEDLASTPALSAVTTNTKTSFSVPEQMKMLSLSVPAFNHDEMDYRKTDCASVSSFEFDRLKPYNTSSSICSEVASMSSVTGSAMSIYSSEFGNVEVKGTIQFAIHYLQKLGEFHIFVVQCEHLAVADPKRNRSDPYVKCYLLPDKAKYGKKKTCVRKKTLDPTYNEILRFKVPMDTLKTLKLNLSVWHNDTFGHNSFLGETELDLAEWDFNNTQRNEYLLKGRQAQVLPSPIHSACSEEIRAEMRVVLRFLSQTSDTHKNKVNGEVQIWVKECKNLPISRGSIDPFVKCTILPDTTRKSHQKTRVLKKACNPEFNHTMVYEGFKPEDLKEACVELTVWDHDRLHNYFIGGIRLGAGTGKSYGADVDWMDSNGAEAALWERMMQCHNEWVEGVLPLRMLVMARMSR